MSMLADESIERLVRKNDWLMETKLVYGDG